jgi:hypothetical protein
MPEPSLRWERAESTRLAWAFVLSVALHLLALSGYEAGRRLHLWQRVQWPAWMVAPRMLSQLFIKPPTARQREQLEKRRQEQERREQMPLVFVDVSPDQATPEPPEKANYYSSKHSLAANPEATIRSTIPKIDGTQTLMPKTEDVPRQKPAFPLLPAPRPAPSPPAAPAQPKPELASKPKPEPIKEPKPEPARQAKLEPPHEVKPMAALEPGDLALVRPAKSTHKGEVKLDAMDEAASKPAPARLDEPAPKGEANAGRPPKRHTLEEVPAEERMAALAGEKMKQEGGVSRLRLKSSLNVLESPFGAYDEAIIAAVQDRWYELLDRRGFAGSQTGKVVWRFHLNADGSVDQLERVENTVDLALALLCESAITDPAPFAKWPAEMRKEIGAPYREVTFTFYYR